MEPRSTKLSPEAINVLRNLLWFDGTPPKSVRLPDQLERPLYLEVNRCLEALGGKWSRQKKAHIFKKAQKEAVEKATQEGAYVDPKKAFEFFPTPEELARRMVEIANIQPGDRVLEPSAGQGAIALALRDAGAVVTCVETMPENAAHLRELGFEVVEQDFTTWKPEEPFDAVVMNPPFSVGTEHVTHARSLIKPETGRLVAILDQGVMSRSDAATKAFRKLITESEELPHETFKESGTSVRTVLLQIHLGRLNGIQTFKKQLQGTRGRQQEELREPAYYIAELEKCFEESAKATEELKRQLASIGLWPAKRRPTGAQLKFNFEDTTPQG